MRRAFSLETSRSYISSHHVRSLGILPPSGFNLSSLAPHPPTNVLPLLPLLLLLLLILVLP